MASLVFIFVEVETGSRSCRESDQRNRDRANGRALVFRHFDENRGDKWESGNTSRNREKDQRNGHHSGRFMGVSWRDPIEVPQETPQRKVGTCKKRSGT